MTAGIEIEIRKIRGPGGNVLVKATEEGHIVSIVPFHHAPGPRITIHAAKPEVLAGVWELPPETKERTSSVKLVAIQLECPAKNLESVYSPKRWARLKAVVQKAGLGFFEIEGIAIVGNRNIATREDLMKILCEHSVIFGATLVPWIIRQRSHGNGFIALEFVGKT